MTALMLLALGCETHSPSARHVGAGVADLSGQHPVARVHKDQGRRPDGGSNLESIFGSDAERRAILGSDAENPLGGLLGAQISVGGCVEADGGLSCPSLGLDHSGDSDFDYGPGATTISRPRSAHVVSLGAVRVRGPMHANVIRQIFRRHLNELEYCYLKERMHSPALAGRLVLALRIDSTGNIATAAVESSTIGAPVEECVVAAVQKWAFPKPRGIDAAVVTYPLEFIAN